MPNSAEHKILIAHKTLNAEKLKTFLAFKLLIAVFIMLMNDKMQTIVGNHDTYYAQLC